MNIENYFEQEKGITVDAARNAGAKYTAIDICRFAKKYHESEVKNLSSNTVLADSAVLKEVNDVLTRRFGKDIWLKGMYNDEVIYIGCEKNHSIKIRIEVVE